jgi:hypothetical protein
MSTHLHGVCVRLFFNFFCHWFAQHIDLHGLRRDGRVVAQDPGVTAPTYDEHFQELESDELRVFMPPTAEQLGMLAPHP